MGRTDDAGNALVSFAVVPSSRGVPARSQRTSGSGVEIYVDQVVQQPGFYMLAAQGSDTVMVALNQDRKELNQEI